MKLSIDSENKQKLAGFLAKKWVTRLISAFMLLFTAGMLVFLIFRQKDVLLSYTWDLNWLPLMVALVIHLPVLLLGAYVWAQMIDSLGPRLSFAHHFRAFCLNMMARRIPGTFWYVAYRAQAYQQHGFSVKQTSVASGVELAVSIISGGMTALVFGLLIGSTINAWLFLFIFIAGIVFLNPLSLKWIFHKLSMQQIEIPAGRLLHWILLYVLLWILGGLILMLIAMVFYPMPLRLTPHVVAYWALVGTVTQLLVFLPSNFGVSEVSLSLLLSQHMPSSIAVIIAVAARVVFIAFELFWSSLTLIFVKDRS